jgi:predicted phosphodiesterase
MDFQKELFLCDLHFPDVDYNALETMFTYCKSQKFTYIVLGGDLVDFKAISGWLIEPDQKSLKNEINELKDFLALLRDRFKKSKIYYVEGNHEERLYRYLYTRAPELDKLPVLEIENLLQLKDFNIKYVKNKQNKIDNKITFNVNNLYHLHGHEIKITSNVINPAKIMFEKMHSNCIFGHHHRSAEWVVTDLSGQTFQSVSVGCLCNLSQDYSPYNNWNHGFAIVEYYNNNRFKIYNKRIIDRDVF